MALSLCTAWIFFLGASAIPLLWWLIVPRRPLRTEPPGSPLPLGILYLTPACIAALGQCASPTRLHRMSTRCIGHRLDRFTFPVGESKPDIDRYSTWPEQARLLSTGAEDQLRALQAALIEKYGPPAPTPLASTRSDAQPAGARIAVFVLLLALLLAALMFWLLARSMADCRCAAPGTTPSPPVSVPPTTTVPGTDNIVKADLQTDFVFDFKLSTPRSPAHSAKMREDLKALFLPFNGIEVLAIVAHTDPIGGTEDNKLLGEKRAQFIRNMIQEIIAAPARSQQFSDNPLPTDGVLDGPKKSDFAFWQSCFKDYYLDVKDGFYPLLNLSRKKNIDNRPACTEATAETGRDGLYPACARLKIPEPDQPYPKGYAQRAERLQQLTACLAPMRHVFIKFRFDHQVQAPSQ